MSWQRQNEQWRRHLRRRGMRPFARSWQEIEQKMPRPIREITKAHQEEQAKMKGRLIHKPGCPSPWMCLCQPEFIPDPYDPLAGDLAYDLAVVFRWLVEHDNPCRECVLRCMEAIGDARNFKPDEYDDEGKYIYQNDGHWPWMCPACKNAIDTQAQESLDDMWGMLQRARKKR